MNNLFSDMLDDIATSRHYASGELLARNPDALLPDLSDTELVIRTLDKL